MSATALVLWNKQLSQQEIDKIIYKAKQWALLHGVQMMPQCSPTTCQCHYAPMTLFPSPVPADVITQAKSLQKHYNYLMHRVANDHEFLENSLKNVVQVDEFTKMLWDIYTEVHTKKPNTQPVSLGLFRNDYMMDVKDSCCTIKGLPASLNLKQIEFNTIASSFAGLSTGIWSVHKYNLSQAGVKFARSQIPENRPAHGLALGLQAAWSHYGVPSACVVFIVQDNETNLMDQKWLEKNLCDIDHNIEVVYSTLLYAAKNCILKDDDTLLLDGKEIAVIYFRNGYSPDHYTCDEVKDIRLTMELSKAIKCPPVNLQLAGCKKIQQELAAPGAVEKYIKDLDICVGIRQTFAGQYSLDKSEEGDKNIEMAMLNPEKFVLKPQREGGGNNFYGEDVRTTLQKIKDSDERNAYILMERIFPWPQKNYLLKEGKDPILRDVISELGIYGVYLGSADTEIYNEVVGHLLRTKSADDNEGGIAAGYATIDSPLLVQASSSRKC
ncbi:hypothetical protein ACF0H5_006921 [Mactra antiquata]